MRILKDNSMAVLRTPRQTYKEMLSSEMDVSRPVAVLFLTAFFSFLFGVLNPRFLNDSRYWDIWGDILFLAYRDTSFDAFGDLILSNDFFILEITYEFSFLLISITLYYLLFKINFYNFFYGFDEQILRNDISFKKFFEMLAYANVPMAIAFGIMSVIGIIRIFVAPPLFIIVLIVILGIGAVALILYTLFLHYIAIKEYTKFSTKNTLLILTIVQGAGFIWWIYQAGGISGLTNGV